MRNLLGTITALVVLSAASQALAGERVMYVADFEQVKCQTSTISSPYTTFFNPGYAGGGHYKAFVRATEVGWWNVVNMELHVGGYDDTRGFRINADGSVTYGIKHRNATDDGWDWIDHNNIPGEDGTGASSEWIRVGNDLDPGIRLRPYVMAISSSGGGQGDQGPQGKAGADGAAGTAGTAGDQGAQGDQGKQGPAGDPAPCVQCQDVIDAAFDMACQMFVLQSPSSVDQFQAVADAAAAIAIVNANVCPDSHSGFAGCAEMLTDQVQAVYDDKF